MGVIQTVSGLMHNPIPEGRLDDILRPEGDNPVMQHGFATTSMDALWNWACIISTAQQASPNVIGHIEPVRAQFHNASIDVVAKPCCISGLSPSGRRMSSTRPSGIGLCISPDTVWITPTRALPSSTRR